MIYLVNIKKEITYKQIKIPNSLSTKIKIKSKPNS